MSSKNFSRKQFIKLSTLAGSAFVLDACGVNTNNSKTKAEVEDTLSTIDTSTPSVTNPDIQLDLVDKSNTRYDALRLGFNKRIDKYPEAIAVCTTTEEVAAAVQHAKQKSLPIAVKSGGHSMEGFSCNDGGLVINLSKMNNIEFIEGDKLKVEPGCILSQLYDAILPKGLILPAGSCGTVGLGGLTLGGGYGLFSRKYGLTCDHLLEATMVDGEGNIHNTNDNPELLWALKGGGTGNYGIVTEMVFSTHKAPPTLQAHYLKARNLTAENATKILEHWMSITPHMPASCFSGFVLNGHTLNILITNYDTKATAKLQPLIDDLSTSVDQVRTSKWGTLGKMLTNYYGREEPLNFRNSSAGFFNGFSDVQPYITEVFEKTMNTSGMIYQVNTMGGMIKDSSFEEGSSYAHRLYDFVSELQGYWEGEAIGNSIATTTSEILDITEANGINTQYVNYCSLEFENWEQAYYGNHYSRLQAIKRQYDPNNNIRHPQSIRL